MFADAQPKSPSSSGTLDFAEFPDATNVWQRLTVLCLAVGTTVAVHYLLEHLHTILVPFFLSGFLVFALQPSVEFTFSFLAGLSPPYRWMGCCCIRRGKRGRHSTWKGSCAQCFGAGRLSPDEEAQLEQEPLLEQVPTLTAMLCEAACRFFAVFLALMCLMCVMSLFLFLLGHGAMHMKEHWKAYEDGLKRLERLHERVINTAKEELNLRSSMDSRLMDAYDKIMDQAQGVVWYLMNAIVKGVSEGVSQMLIVLLYVLFWLMQPLPIDGKASEVVRSYLWKKSFVSLLYGTCITIMFFALGIDLAVFFGVVSFFLNFIPEVGAFISMILPVPVILLDGRLKYPISVLVAQTIGQVLLKFVVGNIIEMKLIERDREMNMHPVWIILGLAYFSYIWGPLGALMSVPMLAMVKMAALSWRGEGEVTSVVPALAEGFLACFEGRKMSMVRSNVSPGVSDASPRAEVRRPPPPRIPLTPPYSSTVGSPGSPLSGDVSPPGAVVANESLMAAQDLVAAVGKPTKGDDHDRPNDNER